MSPKTTMTAIAIGFMAMSAPLVYADGGPEKADAAVQHEGGWRHHDPEQKMARVLNLSGEQMKQLKALHQKQREAMKATFEQIKANRKDFDAEIAKAAPDMNKINENQTQLKAIQARMIDAHLTDLLEIKKILTPEQFAGYMALKKEKQMDMMHKHGFKGHRWGKDGDHDKDGDHSPDND